MTSFLLLRNNQETGPFTYDELLTQNLKTTDLIWINGESTAWEYPTEIESFKHQVAKTAAAVNASQLSMQQPAAKNIFVALPPEIDPQNEQSGATGKTEPEIRFARPLEALQQNEAAYKTKEKASKTFSKPHAALWGGCVFAGLLLSAGILKKLIDAYDENAVGLAAPAALPVYDMGPLKSLETDPLYQNALTTELVPVDTATLKPVKKEPAKINLKKLVRVEANDYRVGLLGGIKNLRLLVSNKTPFVLDVVKIELHYLKPNGDVLKTEMLTVKKVGAKSSKSLSVAPQKRGVNVSCFITDIKTKQDAENLVRL